MATNDDPQMHRLAAQSGINKLPVERNLRHMHSTESVLASIIESNIQTSTRFEQEVERGQRRKGEGGVFRKRCRKADCAALSQSTLT